MLELTAQNYHSPQANKAYLSNSQIGQFLHCEVMAMAILNGEYIQPKTIPLLVGGYVDAYFAGELTDFKRQNPEIFKVNGMLKSEYIHAEKIIARLERDPLAMRMLEGKRQEIVTGEIFGQPCKAKLDCLLDSKTVESILDEYPEMSGLMYADGAIVDMKIMKDFKPIYVEGGGLQTFIEAWGQDRQMALYQFLIKQKTGKQLPTYILGATKEPEPDIDLFEIPQEIMDMSFDLLGTKMPRIVAVKNGNAEPVGCGTCPVCRQKKRLTRATWAEAFA